MQNILFEYLYRDEDNYKDYASVIYSNPDNLSIKQIQRVIEHHLIEGAWFEPVKWGIPLFSYHRHNPFGINDYIWYEFEQLTTTTASAVGGSINDLLNRIV